MGGRSSATTAEAITIDDFKKLLKQYPTLIRSISIPKPGQTSLTELDEFRYEKAIEDFSSGRSPQRAMNHNDVKLLVEWKLRHGKFRPTLMSLVTSNSADAVKEVVEDAVPAHREGDTTGALKTLCRLRGVGPATASLLLSVHDPENVIFFSDEAYYWLCGGGDKVSLKYNPKEYDQLKKTAEKLQKRLGVSATAIEKVAYVIMKMSQEDLTSVLSKSQSGEASTSFDAPEQLRSESETGGKSEAGETMRESMKKSGAKRKPHKGPASAPVDSFEEPTRRSKRLRS